MAQNGQPVSINHDLPKEDFSYITKNIRQPIPPEKITIEIFDKTDCPQCTKFILHTLSHVLDIAKETNLIDIRLFFIPEDNERHYKMAMSLKCASDQMAFWDMLNKIHRFEDDIDDDTYIQFGNELDLNLSALKECIDSNAHDETVRQDIKYASEKEIKYYPTILINHYTLIGNQPFENIQKIINELMREISEKN